jgi:hypothetical protein
LRVQATNSRSRFEVTTDGTGVVGHAGAALLGELADRLGLTRALGWHLVGGRRRHADAVVLRDLAVMLADGGDCLSDLAALRDQPELFGQVASTATAWRVLERVATDPDGLARLRAARAQARARAWTAGGDPAVERLVIDADATLVLAHSDAKQGAAGTYKGSFGFHPLLAYLDRGQAPGEPLAGLLRPGNAPAGGTDDLIELVDLALAQLPSSASDQPVLVRSDSAGASTRLAWHLRGRGVGFSVGMQIDAHIREAILAQPEPAWTPAIDADGQPREGAEVCELTSWIDLHTWPEGTRAICRREDAHPAPSCASPTLTATASRSSSPTNPTLTWPAWSCGTANAPGSRTASAPPRPPASRTCRSTAGDATPSGWSWSWPPKTSPSGRRRCCWTVTWPSPSPRRCATGCCTSLHEWCATPAARSFACNAPGPGRSPSPGRSPAYARSRCAAEPPAAPTIRPTHCGSWPACHQPPTRSPRPAQQPQQPPRPATQPSPDAATRPDPTHTAATHTLMKSRG